VFPAATDTPDRGHTGNLARRPGHTQAGQPPARPETAAWYGHSA